MDPVEHLRFIYHGTVPFIETVYLMGISVLSEHLHTVASVLINGTRQHSYQATVARRRDYELRQETSRIQESLAFVQGTGLNLIIQEYGFEVDPDEFREGFFNFCDYQKRLRESRAQRKNGSHSS